MSASTIESIFFIHRTHLAQRDKQLLQRAPCRQHTLSSVLYMLRAWGLGRTLRSAISSSSRGCRVGGASARPSCSGPLPLAGDASAASSGSMRSRRAAAGEPACSGQHPSSGPEWKGRRKAHSSCCYRLLRHCAPRSRTQLLPGPPPFQGGWRSITEVLWSPGSCRSLPVRPMS